MRISAAGQGVHDDRLKSELYEVSLHGAQAIPFPKNPGRHPHISSGKRSGPKPSRVVDAGSRPKHP